MVCEICGCDISERRAVRFCSVTCADVAYGNRLPEPLPLRECAYSECGQQFRPKSRRQHCCCEDHGKRSWLEKARAEGRVNHGAWNDRRRDAYHRRRALKSQAATGEAVDLEKVAARDRWKCGICGKRVHKSKVWPHPLSPSLDHLVPLSQGGAHDPANVGLAHLVCNTAKNNRGGNEQLLLIG